MPHININGFLDNTTFDSLSTIKDYEVFQDHFIYGKGEQKLWARGEFINIKLLLLQILDITAFFHLHILILGCPVLVWHINSCSYLKKEWPCLSDYWPCQVDHSILLRKYYQKVLQATDAEQNEFPKLQRGNYGFADLVSLFDST